MEETPPPQPPSTNEYEIFVQQIAALMMCEEGRFGQKLNQLLAESQLNVRSIGQVQAGLYSQIVQLALNSELSEIEGYPEPLREETHSTGNSGSI